MKNKNKSKFTPRILTKYEEFKDSFGYTRGYPGEVVYMLNNGMIITSSLKEYVKKFGNLKND